METKSTEVKKWLTRLEAARRREKDFRKTGMNLCKLYDSGKCTDATQADTPYNILYSNTETLTPALYNSTPRPLVKRRYRDEDKTAAAAGLLGKRVLSYLMDTGNPDHETFDNCMHEAVLEACVPGRGLTRVRYKAKVGKEGGVEVLRGEECFFESVPWNKVLFGYSRRWVALPWMAFIHIMTERDFSENFKIDKTKLKLVSLDALDTNEAEEEKKISASDTSDDAKYGIVYEIWDKSSKKVIWLSEQYDNILRNDDDPYKMQGFYPVPQYLFFKKQLSEALPAPLYKMYEAQAEELNDVTRRIRNIIRCLRVRAVYDTTLGDEIKQLFSADLDGDLIPAENVAALQQGYTIEKALWFAPVDKLITVFQQLLQQREAIKQVIYEITGIADIMRGSSAASETLGAQQIKTQWGTLRLKKGQKAVASYARDLLRLMLELSMNVLSEEALKGISNLPFPTTQEKQQAQQALQEFQAAQQQQAMMAQQVPGTPPPQPQQPPPELVQATTLPTIGELKAMLMDDTQRQWRIDIETNSTIDAEATEDKQDIAELFGSLSQFFNGVGPLIEKGFMPQEVANGMLMAVSRRFNFGDEVEDMLAKVGQQPQQPKPDPKEVEKQQKELEKQEEALKQQQLATEDAKKELEYERKVFELEKQFAQRAMQMEAKFALKEQDLQEQARSLRLQEGISKGEQLLTSKHKELTEAQAGFEEKETEIAEKETAVKSGEASNMQLIQNVQSEMKDLMGAVTQAIQALAAAQSSPRQITDGKGRVLTITPASPGV